MYSAKVMGPPLNCTHNYLGIVDGLWGMGCSACFDVPVQEEPDGSAADSHSDDAFQVFCYVGLRLLARNVAVCMCMWPLQSRSIDGHGLVSGTQRCGPEGACCNTFLPCGCEVGPLSDKTGEHRCSLAVNVANLLEGSLKPRPHMLRDTCATSNDIAAWQL